MAAKSLQRKQGSAGLFGAKMVATLTRPPHEPRRGSWPNPSSATSPRHSPRALFLVQGQLSRTRDQKGPKRPMVTMAEVELTGSLYRVLNAELDRFAHQLGAQELAAFPSARLEVV